MTYWVDSELGWGTAWTRVALRQPPSPIRPILGLMLVLSCVVNCFESNGKTNGLCYLMVRQRQNREVINSTRSWQQSENPPRTLDIWNPEFLSVHFDWFQASVREFIF